MSRYQRAVEIEDLILTLATHRGGLTLAGIAERYDVSRRTAERMRDAVAERFPLCEVDGGIGERRKRWRIEGRVLRGMAQFGPADAEVLEKAAEALDGKRNGDLAGSLRRIAARIRIPT